MTTSLAAPTANQTRQQLDTWFAHAPLANVSFQLWDGSRWPDAVSRPATLVLKHPGALQAIAEAGTERALAEAFLRDDFDVEGDLEAACELADVLAERTAGNWLLAARQAFQTRRGGTTTPGRRWTGRGWLAARQHSRSRDRRAIAFHYDVSNDFFSQWLDARMLYSCAYFQRGDDDLETAQTAKLRHLCRKLRLKPGLRLLDIGCGWGGLALHAARAHGVSVTGVTLSTQQAALASARVTEAGLAAKVVIEEKDYRDVDAPEGFDAIVSVGMAEHVGAAHLAEYFRTVFALLKPGGVFLNHAIGDGIRAGPGEADSFLQAYVFPDSDLQRIPVVLAAAESAGFEVRDVENLREHYTLTLRHWVRRLEAKHSTVLGYVDEPTYRVWRLYMAASARGFDRARLAIYQTLLVKPDGLGRSGLPLTRRDWYTD